MALEGTLKDFSLPDILQLIALQRKTGVLIIRSNGDAVTMHFDDGRLVYVRSSMTAPDTLLGYIMVRTGRITQEQLDDALRVQAQTPKPLGSIMLERGTCSVKELSAVLSIQQRRIFFNLFRLENGEFIFDLRDSIEYEREVITPLNVDMLLMEAAQMLDEWLEIEKVIHSGDIIFRRLPARHSGMLEESESAVLDVIDGTRSVKEVFSQTMLSEFDCYKALYNLASRGVIEEVDQAPVGFEILNHQPSVNDFIEKMRGLIPSRCFDVIEALPESALSNAVVLVVSLSMQSVLWSPNDSAFDEWIEPLTGIISDTTRDSDMKTGVFESITDNIGLAIFCDFESDFALMVADTLTGKSGVSRFRSQVARMASRLLPANRG